MQPIPWGPWQLLLANRATKIRIKHQIQLRLRLNQVAQQIPNQTDRLARGHRHGTTRSHKRYEIPLPRLQFTLIEKNFLRPGQWMNVKSVTQGATLQPRNHLRRNNSRKRLATLKRLPWLAIRFAGQICLQTAHPLKCIYKSLPRHFGLSRQQLKINRIVAVFRLFACPQLLPGCQSLHRMAGRHLTQQSQLVLYCAGQGTQSWCPFSARQLAVQGFAQNNPLFPQPGRPQGVATKIPMRFLQGFIGHPVRADHLHPQVTHQRYSNSLTPPATQTLPPNRQ